MATHSNPPLIDALGQAMELIEDAIAAADENRWEAYRDITQANQLDQYLLDLATMALQEDRDIEMAWLDEEANLNRFSLDTITARAIMQLDSGEALRDAFGAIEEAIDLLNKTEPGAADIYKVSRTGVLLSYALRSIRNHANQTGQGWGANGRV